jgi:hypothetical protein
MSLPGLPPQALATAMSISPIDSFLHVFNTNQYFIGIMMLVLNLGGRFISLEVTKKQEQFLQHPWIRRLLIFTVFFVATRNIWVAFWLTITVILFLGYIFNENSALCIFGSGGSVGSKCDSLINKQSDDLTPEEKEILQRLSAKQQRYQQQVPSTKNTQQGANSDEDEDNVDITDIYAANVSLLKS